MIQGLELKRREFLYSCSALAVSALIPSSLQADDPHANRLSIVQGITDANSTSLLIVHKKTHPLQVLVTDALGFKIPHTIVYSYLIPGTIFYHTEISVHNLVLGMEYRISAYDSSGRVLDERRFETLDIYKSKPRFAIVSCMADYLAKEGASTWQALYDEHPDFVILNGDTVYADSRNPDRDAAGYGRRYMHARRTLAWYYMPTLIPTFATWDDHDFGLNDADRTFPMADFTGPLFRTFWGRRFTASCKQGFGVGSLLTVSGQRFFIMDCRTWRDPSFTNGYHWGCEQREWFLSELRKSNEPVWIVNGSRFFGGHLHKEAYEGDHETDFKYLLGELSKIQAPVCFVSGDIHASEIMAIEPQAVGYPTFEYTSSSIHSSGEPQQNVPWKNPRRVAADGRYNFMIFESVAKPQWSIDMRCVVEGNQTAFAHSAVIQRG